MSKRETLDRRLQRFEDIEALRNLKHRYCTYCDGGYDADRLAPLFTEDAIWDGGPLGYFSGRAAIHKFFVGCSKVVSFAIHHVTNSIIVVDGDRATGEWLLWEPMVFARSGEQAMWMAARYNDIYRRVDGEWRFAHVKLELRMLSPYEEGFADVFDSTGHLMRRFSFIEKLNSPAQVTEYVPMSAR